MRRLEDQHRSPERYPGVEFRAMNSLIAAIGKTDTPLPYWQRPVVQWFAEMEKKASRFLPDSDLSRLNRTPAGQPMAMSQSVFRLLRNAWDYAARTDYMFQPFFGGNLQKLGYDRSFELLHTSLPSSEHPGIIMPVAASDALTFNEDGFMVTRHLTSQLDLGGIGKGWSTDRAASLMRREFGVSAGMVDAGGDLYVWSDEDPWCIGIQNPYNEEEELLQLWVMEAGIATSNVLHRRWMQGERIRHHILDGRTGLPAESDVVQATVLASETSEAEVASKVICMLGSEAAPAWMAAHFPQFGYVFVKNSGEMTLNRKLYDYAVKVV